MIKGILKFKKLRPDAVTPKYATPGAACFDIAAIVHESFDSFPVCPGNTAYFSTGLSFEVPEGWVMLIYSRSGHGFKNGVRLSNCVGVIDSDYRGEVNVKLKNDGEIEFNVRHGDRIAQAMLVECGQWDLIESDSLSETERGERGFGSTGTPS